MCRFVMKQERFVSYADLQRKKGSKTGVLRVALVGLKQMRTLHCIAALQVDLGSLTRLGGYPFQGRLGANMVWLEARWAPEANGQPVPVSTSR